MQIGIHICGPLVIPLIHISEMLLKTYDRKRKPFTIVVKNKIEDSRQTIYQKSKDMEFLEKSN
jgi:hypothetical protein